MAEDVDVALSVDALGSQLTGIGRYCLELARRLPGSSGVGKVKYFSGMQWMDDIEPLISDKWVPIRRGNLARLHDWRCRRAARRSVIHGPNFYLPEWAEQGVLTVHDLSVLLYPETHPAERIAAFERTFLRSIYQAKVLITDSETVRQELLATFGFPEERIKKIPLGVSRPTANTLDQHTALRSVGLSASSYVLCVSTFEPRKRIDLLISAYSNLPPVTRDRFPLVLVGASGWCNDALNLTIAEAVSQGWMKSLRFVSEAMLQALYAGAALFVYPSQYEGFGLPPIEAMAHGVPTIVSDAACLVEITKGAARVIDPMDLDSFSASIAEALEDEQWRRAASKAGYIVADGYNWNNCISETVEVYRSVVIG